MDITRQVSYTYDATGNRTGMTTDQGATSYKYDAAGRLLEEDGPSGTIANQYDPAGRLTAQQNGAEQIAYTYNGADQLTTARYTDQTQVTYGYDALGRTALRTENLWELPGEQGQGRGKGKGQGAEKLHQKTGTTRYSFDELTNTIAKEYTGQGGPVLQYYSANDEVIAAKQFGLKDQIVPGREPDLKTTGGLMYYQTDARRTVTEITDRQGGVVDRYRYDAFGGLFTGITAPYNTMGLTGHQYDAKTGLVDMNARWYAPTTGRFLTPDTWPGTLTEPSTQNPYVYVGDNPMTNWDPSGHCPDPMGVSYCADDSGGNTATYYFLEGKGSSSSYQTIKTWRDLQGSYQQYAWSELDWWKYEVMDVTWTDRSKGQGSWTTSDQTFSQILAGSGVNFTPYANPQQKEAGIGPARNSAAGPLPAEVIAQKTVIYQSWQPPDQQIMELPTMSGSLAASKMVDGFVNKALFFGKRIATDAAIHKDISQYEAEKGIPEGTLDGGSAAQILAAYSAGISSVRSKMDNLPTPGPLLADLDGYGGGSGDGSTTAPLDPGSLPSNFVAAAKPAERMDQEQKFFAQYGLSSACTYPSKFGCGQGEVDFTNWEYNSGRLQNSAYWNLVNQSLTQDKLTAQYAYEHGLQSTGNANADLWLAFIKDPSPNTFWAAHSASILSGHQSDAAQAALKKENSFEQWFVSVIVVPAALTAGPLAGYLNPNNLPWWARIPLPGVPSDIKELARWINDPSSDGVKWFVNHLYPQTYPTGG